MNFESQDTLKPTTSTSRVTPNSSNSNQEEKYATCFNTIDKLENILDKMMFSMDLVNHVQEHKKKLNQFTRLKKKLLEESKQRVRTKSFKPKCVCQGSYPLTNAVNNQKLWLAQDLGARCEDAMDRYVLDAILDDMFMSPEGKMGKCVCMCRDSVKENTKKYGKCGIANRSCCKKLSDWEKNTCNNASRNENNQVIKLEEIGTATPTFVSWSPQLSCSRMTIAESVLSKQSNNNNQSGGKNINNNACCKKDKIEEYSTTPNKSVTSSRQQLLTECSYNSPEEVEIQQEKVLVSRRSSIITEPWPVGEEDSVYDEAEEVIEEGRILSTQGFISTDAGFSEVLESSKQSSQTSTIFPCEGQLFSAANCTTKEFRSLEKMFLVAEYLMSIVDNQCARLLVQQPSLVTAVHGLLDNLKKLFVLRLYLDKLNTCDTCIEEGGMLCQYELEANLDFQRLLCLTKTEESRFAPTSDSYREISDSMKVEDNSEIATTEVDKINYSEFCELLNAQQVKEKLVWEKSEACNGQSIAKNLENLKRDLKNNRDKELDKEELVDLAFKLHKQVTQNYHLPECHSRKKTIRGKKKRKYARAKSLQDPGTVVDKLRRSVMDEHELNKLLLRYQHNAHIQECH